MPKKVSLFILRISMGWLFLYAGLIKLFDSEWSVTGYLGGAKTLTPFYNWLLQPEILPIINIINEWGLTLLGVSLILGLFVRLSSFSGAVLMFLYYFPVLDFPHVGTHGYLIDEHIIYALVLVFLAIARAGRFWGLDALLKKLYASRRIK